MISRTMRFFIALILTLVIAGATLIVAKAQTDIPNPPLATTTANNCNTCHSDVYEIWHQSGHGDIRARDALEQQGNCLACHKEIPDGSVMLPKPVESNSEFNDFWTEQGKPNNCLQCHVTGYNPADETWKAEGITCEACHNPIPSDHPNKSMPVDKSTDLCSTCHTNDRFGWETWKTSVHYQNNMTCSNCHNPHSTSIKLASQSDADISSLCENCHKEIAQNAIHSNHAKAGATCVKCHIGSSKGTDDFHKVPDHDFKPKLEACNDCHADQMHSAGTPISIPTSQNIPIAGVEVPTNSEPAVTVTPGRVNPFGFAGLAALFGLIGGVVWSKSGKRRLP